MNHGGTYKISSAKDGTVLDAAASKFQSGTKVLCYSWHGGKNQKWKVDKEVHGFRMACAGGEIRPGGMIVLDESVSEGKGLLYAFHGGKNQQWNCLPVPNVHNTFYIKNEQTGKVLTHAGNGNQVSTAPLTTGNSSQWWNFQAV